MSICSMRASTSSAFRVLCSFSSHRLSYSCPNLLFSPVLAAYPCSLLCLDMENVGANPSSSIRSKSSSSISTSRSGRGFGKEFRKGGTIPSDSDRIAALGRLLTRILRHMAVELNLKIRSDGYVRIRDLLQLNITTYAKVPLKSHTIEEIKEAVRRDNKQRFNLLEEGGELLIRANQGHSITTVTSENLLRPILSADEVQICVHGTYRKNLKSILQSGLKRMDRLHVHFASGMPTDGEVISGMRRDIDILIFLDVGRALKDGMKLYVSDNEVILTEGFDGVVPVKYFEKIETWPRRESVSFSK